MSAPPFRAEAFEGQSACVVGSIRLGRKQRWRPRTLGGERLLAVVCLVMTTIAAQASSCRTPPVAALPAAAAEWGPQDEAFFASPTFCKSRGLFDFQSVSSRKELDVVKAAMGVIEHVAYLRGDGPPFPNYIRPPPVGPDGWRQMNDPSNAVPFVPDTTGGRVPRIRDGPSRIMNFRVVGPDRVCVDIEFNWYRKTEPRLVQTHVFERGDKGAWLFTGFAGPDCAPVARPAN